MREHFTEAIAQGKKISPEFKELVETLLQKYEDSDRVAERKEQDTTISSIEDKVDSLTKYEQVIQKWLARYGVEADIRKNESGQLEISATEVPPTIPALPNGYGYKGGVARTILEYSLGLPYTEPRDLDIVFLGTHEDESVSKKLAEQYMPEDFANGYGVEPLEADYFSTRDFTLNEVLYDGSKIVCTRQCLTDLLRNIVRFTDYEKNESYHGDDFFIKPKLLAKAVRMVALARNAGKAQASITDEINQLRELYIDDFHLALHLDRAMEQGNGVAKEYVRIMNQKGFIPDYIQTVSDCFEYLVGRTEFIFRSAPQHTLDEESHFIADMADEYSSDTPLSPIPLWKDVRKHRNLHN
jgi:hypothetical protein